MAIAAAVSACGGGGGPSQQDNSQLVDTGASQSGVQGASATPGAGPTKAGATSVPGGTADVKVSSSNATSGNFTITLTVGPQRRMAPENSASATPAAQNQQGQQGQNGQGQGGAAQEDVVLGNQALHVNKNLDAAQAPPPDPKDGQGDYIRHVDIQVKDKSTGQVVPYLDVTMDVLKDGRPVQYDVALVPAVPSGGKPDELHYGNNVAFPGKGHYQLFVRMPSNPMVGDNSPPSTQFEVDIQ